MTFGNYDHAPARDPSDEYDGGHPIRIGLGDGVEGSAKAPFIMGVSGEQERSLTGDATAIRCTGFDDLLNGCP